MTTNETNETNETMESKEPQTNNTAGAQDFAALVEAQNRLNTVTTDLDRLQVALDQEVRRAPRQFEADYVVLAEERQKLETKIRELVERHPEWLTGQTLQTPFGKVSLRRVQSLDVEDEDRTIARVQLMPAEMQEALLRKTVALNREGLELLEDDALAMLGVTRTVRVAVTIKAPTVPAKKLGKKVNAPSDLPVRQEGGAE